MSLNGVHSPESSDGSSPVMISSSGLVLSTSDLHSVSSISSGGSAQGYHHVQHHGSTTSIGSGAVSSGSGDSVFTNRSSPQELVSTTAQRSKSTSPDGSCVPDSTTISTSSPLSVQTTGKIARADSADLGYKSGSSSSLSLRDRLKSGVGCGPSPITRTDSNASSIISNNPLSASSSVRSLHSHGSIASATDSEFNSHSTFHQGSTLDSNNFMPTANSTFTPLATPTDQYNNIQYVQNQPISAASNASFPLIHQQQMGTQFVISAQFGAGQVTMMGNGTPQQFVQQSNLLMNGVGVDPINSLPDWTPAPAVSNFNGSSSTSTFLSNAGGVGGIPPQQRIDPMFGLETTGGPGFEYITPSVPGTSLPQEIYNPPPITTSGSNMYNGSAAGMRINSLILFVN